MKTISDLLTTVQPSIVGIQSSVLVMFMISFAYLIWRISGSKVRNIGHDISRRAIED